MCNTLSEVATVIVQLCPAPPLICLLLLLVTDLRADGRTLSLPGPVPLLINLAVLHDHILPSYDDADGCSAHARPFNAVTMARFRQPALFHRYRDIGVGSPGGQEAHICWRIQDSLETENFSGDRNAVCPYFLQVSAAKHLLGAVWEVSAR